jgi:hypothetical protein
MKVSSAASIKTHEWAAYGSLAKEMPNLKTKHSIVKGKSFGVMQRVIINFTS